MTDHQSTLNQIRRLLGSFPARGGDEALLLHGYLKAVDGFSIDFVEDGVDLVLRGELPGHDGRFAPTAPMLATACRMAAERASQRKYREGLNAPRLPPPDITHTDEERARAKAKVQAFIETQGAIEAHTNAEQLVAQKDRWDKVNAFFAPPMDSTSVLKRLGYEIGSPESEDNAA